MSLTDNNSKIKENKKEEPVLLTALSNQTEEMMIVSLLEDAGIPVLVKDKGSGSYMKLYMGYSIFGSDIYVRKSDYEKAFNLLEYYYSNNNETSEGSESNQLQKEEPMKDMEEADNIPAAGGKTWAARIIIAVFILSVIIAVLFNHII